MSNHKVYKEKVDAQLKEWEAKAELLKAKGNNLAADAKVDFENQLKELEDEKSEFTAYAESISDKAEDAWDDFKDDAEDKWDSLSSKVKKFVSKYS